MTKKRLYRSKKERIIGGVCGGLGPLKKERKNKFTKI